MDTYNLKRIIVPEDSKEFSYFLGLCASDGNVYKYSTRFEIQKRDEHVLRSIKDWSDQYGWKAKISHTKKGKYSKLSISSKILVEVLNRYGIVPAKSKIIRLVKPAHADQFLRGYFDGNGTIQLRRNGIEITFHSGSEGFLKDINEWIDQLYHVGLKTVEKHGRAWRITYYSNQSKIISEQIWKDPVIFIPRKYEKFRSFVKTVDPRIWKENELSYLRMNYRKGTDSWKQIAKYLGKSNKSVSCKISRLKLNG